MESCYIAGRLLVCVMVLVASSRSLTQESVDCNAGKITGSTKTIPIGSATSNVTMFLGIPYAEPPVGLGRFAKPVRKAKFQNDFLALKFGASCPQFNPLFTPDAISEDCLFLNIYSPATSGSTGNGKLPVMVWIHGGGFIIGDGSVFGGEKLAAYGQVVVVTLNYRLGPFGFINLDESSVDANNGLRDQQLAIQWVSENIECFNGDRGNVTIFGESAGAAAVMYQAIYPPNAKLIHRVIAESGSCNAPWALVPNPGDKAKQFASNLKCPVSSTTEMVKCLRSKTNLTEMAIASDLRSLKTGQHWNPSADEDFVKVERVEALKTPIGKRTLATFQQLDLLMGTNGYDGQSFLVIPQHLANYLALVNASASSTDIKYNNRQIISDVLHKLYLEDVASQILDSVEFEYTNYEEPGDNDLHRKQSTDFMTDVQFLLPAFTALENHAFKNTVASTYQYDFNHLFPFISQDSWIEGALHSQEILYVFGFPRSSEKFYNYTQDTAQTEWDFSMQVMDYWTNFAKTGNPNEPRKPKMEWTKYSNKNRDYLYMVPSVESRSHLHGRHLNFLANYLPSYITQIENLTRGRNSQCTSSAASHVSYTCMMVYFIWLQL